MMLSVDADENAALAGNSPIPFLLTVGTIFSLVLDSCFPARL